MTPALRRLATVAAGLLLALLVGWPGLLGDYGQFVVASIAFYAIAVMAVSVLAGLCGIWSMGHTAFMAIGAYMAAQFALYSWPVELAILCAAAAAGAAGFLLGFSAGRFSVLYFGLLTLALCMAATEIIGHWTSVTGGDEGIAVLQARSILLGRTLDLRGAVVMTVLLATLALVMVDVVARGPIGRRWLAVKSQRIAAAAMGLRPHVENATAFAFSAAIASLAGVGIAFTISYLDPIAFSLDASVQLIVATVIGGAGSLLGAVLGAVFIVAVPEAARGIANVSVFVFGAATIVVLLFMRRGIVPSLAGWIKPRSVKAPVAADILPIDPSAIEALVRACLPPATESLAIEHLDLRFGGVKALQDITLAAPAGSTLGLIGPNGAGKTSLLNVIGGFYRASSAQRIRFGEHDLMHRSSYARAGLGMGRTFQHAELFAELTVRENIAAAAMLGAPRRLAAGLTDRSPDAIAATIVAALGLSAYAESYPPALPFGVQKVADIGRALALAPSLVAMDEPFSGLDERERSAIRAILRGMRGAGVTILIIDHAVQEVLQVADRIVVLEFGKVLAEGPPEQIRNDPDVHRAYFGADGAPSRSAAA
ncbi:ATP-binding cassette domain-containing protein [Bosea sp. SSUT16]|jgi:branched-chain amino acid transport system permease protein|uniref:ATP-binding cassette domain-containing protein n=1 Tax=Bosea spartocytisi TaxID=2773451 RepID=A0A927ECU5_9HYPH|nr:ATP-binding cassette domain-containing protein [Bosea spartocytisi]MBD3848092.1 ATP-binding cassette domain-containing protein [Bosea spartocytisi]MCT4473943.1 ATP-binding cassette domain-containing protein [Bosea spartocytisi]